MATIRLESSFGKDALASAGLTHDNEVGALSVVVATDRDERSISEMLRARGYRWTGQNWRREQTGTDRGYGSLPLWVDAVTAWAEVGILLESGCVLSADRRTQNILRDIEAAV